jgi:uncharacterized membrane protein YbhN (UPF0104 family)
MSRRGGAALRVAVALGLLAAVLWWVDPRAVLRVAAQADRGWLALGLGSALAANLVSAWRWRSLVRWLGLEVPLGWCVRIYLRGVAVNALLPGAVVGGDLLRAQALTRCGLPTLEASISVLLDRLSGLWVLVAMAGFALSVSAATIAPALGLPDLPRGAFALFGALWLALPLAVGFLGRAAVPARAAWRARLSSLARRPRALEQYAWQMLGSLGVQVLSIGTLLCAGRALGLDLPALHYVVAAAPTFILASLPVSVGGWGTREAAAVAAFAAVGVPAPAAVAMAMLYGLAALVQAVAGLGDLMAQRASPAV